VRDDVHAQGGIVVVTAYELDQAVEPARGVDVVLPPVVWVDVVPALALARRRAGVGVEVAAELLQRLDDLAVEIAAERLIGNARRFEVVVADLQRRGIEVQRELSVLVEQNHLRRARPDFVAGDAVA